jgi:carbon starvation protein CstA
VNTLGTPVARLRDWALWMLILTVVVFEEVFFLTIWVAGVRQFRYMVQEKVQLEWRRWRQRRQ